METTSGLSCLRVLLPILFFMTFNASRFYSKADDLFNLTILHTNDIHSRFETFTKSEIACKNNTSKYGKTCYGGIARRAGFVNKIRNEHSNVLLLDGGDQFQGTPWFYTYKGVEASHFLNRLKYDAMALGNHEFDNGVNGLVPFLNNVTVPILCSNIVFQASTPVELISSINKSITVTVNNRTIGIIGYVTKDVPSLSKTENLVFTSEIEAVRNECKNLKKQGVDIIIALGHSGLKTDKEMAAALEDVDIIVGGHSHSLLYKGNNPYDDEVMGDYPLVFEHTPPKRTLVVQAGSFGKYVGMLNVTFDLLGNVVGWDGNPVVMDENIPEDEETKNEMKMLLIQVSEKFDHVVGSTKVMLNASENICRISECNIGNLITDSMVSYVQQLQGWQKLTIAFINSGSLRASLPEGNISYADVLTLWPFGDNLVVARLEGFALLEVLQYSISGFDLIERKGKFLQVSGLIVTYDLSRPDGDKVRQVKVRKCFRCDDYEDLVSDEWYDVITQSYLMGGGDGYQILKKYKNDSVPIDIQTSDVFMKYLEHNSPANPQLEGRIIFGDSITDDSIKLEVETSCCFIIALLVMLLS